MIPHVYRGLWVPVIETDLEVVHFTSKSSLSSILDHGLLPCDPAPNYWAGMSAVFMADVRHPLFPRVAGHLTKHVRKKGTVVRLSINTSQQLYRCTDVLRAFQVVAFQPILPSEILVS